jgi:trehalose-phosphatase
MVLEPVFQQIRNLNKIFLMLDFDGTLVPTMSKPDDARLDGELLVLLEKLNSLESVQVAIISGRALDDLRMRVPIDNFTLVGSHGGEFLFSDGESCRETLTENTALDISSLVEQLSGEMGAWVGCILERKPLGLALHYRNAREKVKIKVVSVFSSMASRMLKDSGMHLLRGDEVIELRPESINKGTAVIKLLDRASDKMLHPVYLGNDRTDEDAFRELCVSGTTVLVGPRNQGTLAQFCVASPNWTRTFLQQCLKNWSEK